MEWNHENHESRRFQKTIGFLSTHLSGETVRQHNLLNFRDCDIFYPLCLTMRLPRS